MDEYRDMLISELRAFIYNLKNRGYSENEIYEAVFVKFSELFKDETI